MNTYSPSRSCVATRRGVESDHYRGLKPTAKFEGRYAARTGVGNTGIYCTITRRTVDFSIRSCLTSNPIPGLSGAIIVPCLVISTAGSITSSCQ